MALGTKRKAANTLSKQPLDLPPATVHAYAGATAPEGWAMCDGSEVSRTTYAALFAAIGTTYGVGDGLDTFNLPDMRGQFLRGLDTTEGVDPDFATRTLGSSQADEFKSHAHTMSDIFRYDRGGGSVGADRYLDVDLQGRGTPTINPSGGSETRPKNMAVNYIIKL